MKSKNFAEDFKTQFTVDYNSFNERNIRLNNLNASDAILFVQTSKSAIYTTLDIGYNLQKQNPLPMIFILENEISKEPFKSFLREYPELPIEIVTFDEDYTTAFSKWIVETHGFKMRNYFGEMGLSMQEVDIVPDDDEDVKKQGARLA